ncbi:hydrogenase maturation peptidase HycI [Methanococcus aeolicus]|uniref:hydrogenase maturation peptidase HycI n=1 Tax=Methanococcus aeolicus TaxID=42879 RepID=UPI0021C9CFEC|nr:hydrogenase maturation peptidase HycI [Methanococcus aeolicus]UXM84926.1 hydrogenase maturation peptidase HycI [Methanococcus aeolicus]
MVVYISNIKYILEEYLKDCKKLAIMGVGNIIKGDDGVGIVFINDLIKSLNFPEENLNNTEINKIQDKLLFLNCGVVPENFTAVLKTEKPSHIIIVDAALMGEEVGTIKIINPEDIVTTGFSTHALPMSIIVKYIRHHIDTDILIIGIEPEQIELGAPLSKTIYNKNIEFTKMMTEIINSFLDEK